MKKYYLKEMKKGWFIGNFEPSVFRTTLFEAGYKIHRKNQYWPAHYQQLAIEINLVIDGKVKINNDVFTKGDIFLVEPREVVKPEFLTRCKIVVIKIPSLPQDKVIIN